MTVPTFRSRNPRSGAAIGQVLRQSTPEEIDQAVAAALTAAPDWAASESAARAQLLLGLADTLQRQRDALVELADQETALGAARLNGELDRTVFQLQCFASEILAKAPFQYVDDAAINESPPGGRPRLTRIQVPLGPVAVFAAGNFPFAFSVLGGDTASALAAGCPVVVKAHAGHPLLSNAVLSLAAGVVVSAGLPPGVLQMVQGPSTDVGRHLVRSAGIEAVAFTGSFRGGVSLQAECAARPRPVPFFGELESLNPVIALPESLEARGADLAGALAASITQGSGQFCTSPGVLIVVDSPATDVFLGQLTAALKTQATHPMLTPEIRGAFGETAARLISYPSARTFAGAASLEAAPTPHLIEVSCDDFATDESLRQEVFGPLCLVVRVPTSADVPRTLLAVGGTLTVTVWGAQRQTPEVVEIVEAAMQVAGRVLFSGVPTGVAVTRAQQHGGPWPASTQPQSTSVGFAAMQRFLRPVALQDPPPWLLESRGVSP